jgi:hypothetical protein
VDQKTLTLCLQLVKHLLKNQKFHTHSQYVSVTVQDLIVNLIHCYHVVKYFQVLICVEDDH